MLNNIKKNIVKVREKIESIILANKIISKIALIMTVMLTIATPVYAAPQIGQNTATYILEQLAWLILAVAIVLGVKAYGKGNTARAIIWLVAGGVLYVICKNPMKLDFFGKWIFEILGI